MSGFVTLKDVKKIYQMGEVKIMAADGIDFEIQKGEFAVVVGPSGAGKTTVLNILGGMDTATEGQVLVDGTDIAKYSQKHLTAYRRDDIGFVFQFYNLIPNLTALENVELALQICKDPMDAREVLEDVGLGDRLGNFPAQLSGGEQQRAALAKVLLLDPKIILLDEPTKGLDGFYKKKLAQILKGLTAEGKTILMVSHDIEFCAEYGDTCALFFHGSVVTSAPAREFFAGNSFYTTTANRMARKWYPDAVTAKDVIERCRR